MSSIAVILTLMFTIMMEKKFLEFILLVVNVVFGVMAVHAKLVKKSIFKFLIKMELN